MDSLINQTSARNMYRALDRLPEKLSETFDDAMNIIAAQPEEHSILANQVISWIFYAKRPLQVAELREALAIEPGDTRLDQLVVMTYNCRYMYAAVLCPSTNKIMSYVWFITPFSSISRIIGKLIVQVRSRVLRPSVSLI